MDALLTYDVFGNSFQLNMAAKPTIDERKLIKSFKSGFAAALMIISKDDPNTDFNMAAIGIYANNVERRVQCFETNNAYMAFIELPSELGAEGPIKTRAQFKKWWLEQFTQTPLLLKSK